jgi:hypothetical protein
MAGGTFHAFSMAKTDISLWSIGEILAGIIGRIKLHKSLSFNISPIILHNVVLVILFVF